MSFRASSWLAALVLPSAIFAVPCLGQSASTPPVVRTIYPKFTTIDVPGAKVSGISGINKSGVMVGAYGPNTSGPTSGFSYANGTFTYFDYPGNMDTSPAGINDSGLIVGSTTDGPGLPVIGFLCDGTTFTPLQDGDEFVTYAFGINNAGTVVGMAGSSVNATTGFEERGGKYKTITLPGGCPYNFIQAINSFGELAGHTVCGIYQYGYTVKGGRLGNVDFPGAQETAAVGINDDGLIVGSYVIPGGCFCAFALKNGKYISFAYPGAIYTAAMGVNSSGQVVGGYTFDYDTYHGFVTSPITADDFNDEAGAH